MSEPVRKIELSARARTLRDKARGLKLIRLWVPDPNAPGFAEEAARQAAALRGAPEEEEALDFIEAALLDGGWPKAEDDKSR